MDADGVVHGSRLYRATPTGRWDTDIPSLRKGPVYADGRVGCGETSLSDYAQVIDPITCITCIVQRAEHGGKVCWFP